MTDARAKAVEADNDRELTPEDVAARAAAFCVYTASQGHPITRFNDAITAYLATMADACRAAMLKGSTDGQG